MSASLNRELIKQLRTESHLTQEQLGKSIGYTGAAIRMLEIGKRKGSKKMAEKLADFFHIPIENLYKNEENEESIASNLITKLIKSKIITTQKIDKDTQDIIIFAIQTEINKKLEIIKNKGDNN